MFRTVVSKMLMVLYFVVGALIIEALTFHFLNLGAMPEYFWYNLSLILVIAILIFIIPNFIAQYVIYTIILLIQTVLVYINYSLTKVYGDLLSIEMIRLIDEAGAAMTSSFVYISVMLELILVFALIAIIGFLVLKYCIKDKKNDIKQHFSIFSVMLILSIQMFSIGFSFQIRDKVNSMASVMDAEYILTDEFLMNTSILKTSSYSKFGTYGYYINMIINSIRNDGSAIENATLEYFNSGHIYDGNFVDSDGNIINNKVFGIDQGNNVIVIMMESLEWFGFGDGKYDATFNNLIYNDDQLEEKTFTPNITKLIYGDDYLNDIENTDNDSLISKNFFAKSKTNMSEAQGIIGNFPVAQSLNDIVKHGSDSTFEYAIPHVLKNMGYTTTYVHSHDLSFYGREKTHSALGFDNLVGKNTLKDEDGKLIYHDLDFDDWAAEGEFAANAIKHLVPEDRSKPFYTFYLNVSSHGAYTKADNKADGDAIKYYDLIKYGEDDCFQDSTTKIWKLKNDVSNPTPTLWYSNALENHPDQAEELVYYQCGVKGLDDAIGVIINELKEQGIYDKTTMLLYSDHNAYYDNLSHNVKNLDVNNNNNQELNTIPMIISSPGIKNYNANVDNQDKFLVNNRFCSSYDVVPTLFDLLGVKFNENFYLGHSIFRPADLVYTENKVTKDMVVYYSSTGGLFGEGIYTFNLRTFVTSDHYSDQTIDIFKAECTTILTKLNFISFLNRYDLYKKVTNK